MSILVILASSSVFFGLCIILAVTIKTFHRLWWAPKRLQRLMGSQGIRGPPYRFIHGSTKEMFKWRNEAKSKPLSSLSDHNLLPKLQPYIHCWTSLYGKNYLQWYGSQGELVVTEPKLIREILNDREKLYSKPTPQSYIKKILGDGIAVSGGKKWAKMRKLANHAFQAENLKGMIPAMIESAEAMVERWRYREGEEIEVFGEFRILTSEVISRTAFGSSYLEGKAIFEMLETLTMLSFKNLLKLNFPGISNIFKPHDLLESERLEKGIHGSIKDIIKKREEKAMEGEEDRFCDDFLGLLLRAHNDADKKQRISVDEMVDECKTLYLAGQETTTTLLTWTMFFLAVNTDWQDHARKEVLDLFGKQNPTSDGISKLKIISMIINETLRLYPPIIGVTRKVVREVRLGGLKLPANIVLYLSILAVHHDPQIWGDDANVFRPERFSEGVAKAIKDNDGAFLPFGIGPRICLGFNFAINEAKIALSMILQRYSFTLSPAYVHSPHMVLSPRPQFGLQIILNPC